MIILYMLYLLIIVYQATNWKLQPKSGLAACDIRISNQLLMTRALHLAQPHTYHQASITIDAATLGRRVLFKALKRLRPSKLYSATQCHSDACLIIRVWLCKMESASNQELVANSNIASSLIGVSFNSIKV